MRSVADLLTTAQVAERIDKTISTVNRWAATGKLPVAHKLPGRTGVNLFDPAVVDEVQKAS